MSEQMGKKVSTENVNYEKEPNANSRSESRMSTSKGVLGASID